MFSSKSMIIVLAFAIICSACPDEAKAGPLMDWFQGIRCRRSARQAERAAKNGQACSTCPSPCSTCATPTQFVNTSLQVPNSAAIAGLQPGQCMKTCNQTCSRTVVNYVPCTAYRTAWNRIPVTQYKPVTNSDPCTGCTVTCMRPCTTYTWQMKREPYTTYRPVYRQETYTVPVTTITNDCATGGCDTCPTCPTCPTAATAAPCTSCQVPQASSQYVYPGTAVNQAQNVISPGSVDPPGTYYTYPGTTTAPGGTIDTNGGFQSVSPADTVPELESVISPMKSQRPAFKRIEPSNDSSTSWPRLEGPLQTQTQKTDNANPNQIRSVSEPTANEGWINSAPRYVPQEDLTAQSTVRKRWTYSPVRLASYTTTSVEPESTRGPTIIAGEYQPAATKMKKPNRKANSGWEAVDW